MFQDPGTLLQDPGTLLQDPGTMFQDPGTMFQDPGKWAQQIQKNPKIQKVAETGRQATKFAENRSVWTEIALGTQK